MEKLKESEQSLVDCLLSFFSGSKIEKQRAQQIEYEQDASRNVDLHGDKIEHHNKEQNVEKQV